jgi:UDP-3-O-[3-hydroxymyristoyl] glucosamine N-acyltransferase
MTTKRLYIVGAGGLGQEILHLLKHSAVSKWDEILLCSDRPGDHGDLVCDTKELFEQKQIFDCIIGIGNCFDRASLHSRIRGIENLRFINIDLSDSQSYPKHESNIIGVGNIIMPNSLIGVKTVIGSFNIIGANSGIGHHTAIGDYNFFGPNSFIAGGVRIGSICSFSFGTGFLQNVSVGSNVNSLPYTVFAKDQTEAGTYSGMPAKKVF